MNYDEQNRHIDQIYRSFCTLYKDSIHRECPHTHVHKTAQGMICRECKHTVKIVWTQILCTSCGSKRIPKKEAYGVTKPMMKYCKYCGSRNFKLIKHDRIDTHEVRYSVAKKEIDTNPIVATKATNQKITRHSNPYFKRYMARMNRNNSAKKYNKTLYDHVKKSDMN